MTRLAHWEAEKRYASGALYARYCWMKENDLVNNNHLIVEL